MKGGKKGELTTDTLIPWIITIAVIVLVFILYMALSGKMTSAIVYLKNIFGFAR